jgi:hypothetical protein
MNLSAMTNQLNHSELDDPQMNSRWDAVREPAWECNQDVFAEFHRRHGYRRNVLNCAIPLARAKTLTDFTMPQSWNLDKSLIASVGFGARLPAGLENWSYTPKIQVVKQLPQMKELPREHSTLMHSPWFQSPSQAMGLGLNARHLRYHYQLWNELRPKTLRGVFTTLVYVTPQVGFSLTPHIKLDRVFRYFGALSRMAGPAQLLPACYLYPDARLHGLEKVPAAMFADILPLLGSSFPLMDESTNPWDVVVRLNGPDCYYGYPFSRVSNPVEDVTLSNTITGSMTLPNGQQVKARSSETFCYATLDPKLKEALKLDRDAFHAAYCLDRGVITHDGLPFMLPVEMQSAVFAIILTAWELEMDRPGDLTSYSLKTQHSAIRGYNFYQKIEPYYSCFMRLVHDLSQDQNFETYPLSSHLTHSWLGGNLLLSNQRSEAEEVQGINFLRNYYLQQLDWSMGVYNLWNTVEFRRGSDLESQLDHAGVAFHQMRPQLRHDVHLFQRPLRRASFWPDFNPKWLQFDQTYMADGLPTPQER